MDGRGYGSLFVDADAERGIAAGARWEAELYRQLRRADAVLFIGTEHSIESPWCFAELAMARSLGKPIVPVSFLADAKHPLLEDIQQVVVATDEDLERVERGLRSLRIDLQPSLAWDGQRSPFPGLLAFGERDAGVFFGRRTEIERIMGLLQSSRRRHSGRLLAVVGPSGSGKSSLVHAGVLPRLGQTRRDWIVPPPLRPGKRPLRQLALAFETAFRRVGDDRPLEAIERASETGADGIVELAEDLCRAAVEQDDPAVLIVVDQAEELLTLAGTREGEELLAALHTATRGPGPLWCLLTFRSEFLSHLLQWEGGARLFDDQVLVGPLERERLPEVIERPAALAGIELEAGLVARMVEDTGGGDALPLLGFTLSELYRRATPGQVITNDDYDDLGGVLGALESAANLEHRRLREAGLGALVMPTLTRLVTLGAEGLPTRRRVPLRGLERRERQVIDGFVDARLVVTRDHDGEAVAEVAHEALLRQWTPLKDAIDRSRSDLTVRAEIERAALDWERSSYSDEYLLTGLRLARARRLSGAEGSVTFRRLIATSQEREQRSQERAAKRRRWTLIAAAVAVMGLTVFGISRLDWSAHQHQEPSGFIAPPPPEPTPPPGKDWAVEQTDDGIYTVDFDPSTGTERPDSVLVVCSKCKSIKDVLDIAESARP
jgi:hypothetical protein